ncbi:DUF397 domain-containing protein [Streptomyces albidoflavus]|uniref:DUF397 domain-containing protein n=1 Tax=Streptomyces TaxID=1883 RepID=UPI0033792518
MTNTADHIEWRKSSYSSGGSGNCVEVAATPGSVRVRDSKDTSIRGFAVSGDAWSAFLVGVPAE